MTLADWIKEQLEADLGANRISVLQSLAAKAGVNWHTIEAATRGARMGNYQKARAISQATDWKVTILDLCDETPAATAARIREQFNV